MSRLLTTAVAFASLLASAESLRAQPAAPAAGGAAPAAEPEVVTDPAVKALLDTNPSTPRDLYRVVGLLVDMGYPKVAKPLLTKLAETATDETQLAEIGREFGRPEMAKLAGSPADLQPEARQMAERILAATRNQARDPQRIARHIELLKDPSYDARVNAMLSLRTGEDASVDALVAVLLDPAREAEHAQIRTALAAMDRFAVGPLSAMADSPEERVRISALKAAALFTDAESIAPLYAAAFAPGPSPAVRQTGEAALVYRLKKMPQPAEAAADLYVAARKAFLRRPDETPAGVAPPTVAVWKWDAAAGKPVAAQVPERIAELDQASRLAKTAADITKNGDFARHLAWAAQLEAAIVAAPDAPGRAAAIAAWNAGAKPTATDLEGLLEFTLETDHTLVAAETVRLLATVGGTRALVSPVAGKPSPLVRATTHPDARVRFAAVDSILALNPTEPFVGLGGTLDAVGYFAGSTGARKALVVDQSSARARNVGGLLAGLGYRPETAGSARDAVRILSQDPDFELVLIARPLLLPQLGALVGQLRGDYRTRRLPIAVYCEADEVEYARTLVGVDDFAVAIYEPRSPQALESQLAGLRRQSRNVVSTDERIAQSASILAAAARLLDAGNSALNLRPYEARLTAAAWHPSVAKPLALVLGKFGSPTAQRTLADVASSAALPLEQRQAASQAFCESVIRFGTLLTTGEVLRQYERYNTAESLDQPTQDLLAKMLDVIEAKAAKLPAGATARAAAARPDAAPTAASPSADATAP